MTTQMTLDPALILARLEAIKAAFRRVPGGNAMDFDPQVRKARRKIMAQLSRLQNAALHARWSLDWAGLRPECTEEAADPFLRELLTVTLALFGVSPAGDFLAAPPPLISSSPPLPVA